MNNKKEIITIIVFVLFMSIVGFGYREYLRADSGWDSSYGGGGGSHSSSHSSSSWHSRSRSSSRSGSSSSSSNNSDLLFSDLEKDWIELVITVVTLFVLFNCGIFKIDNSTPQGKTIRNSSSHKGISNYELFMANYDKIIDSLQNGTQLDIVEDEEITALFPNETRDSLLEKLFNKFVDVQVAWMNFDLKKLSVLCSDELYNTYESQLETLKLKNGKNVMKGFKHIYSDIIELNENNGYITIGVVLKVSFYDYVINSVSGKVIRGNKHILMTNCYRLVFVIGTDSKDKCPNCGADVNTVTSTKCEYCGSKIVIKPRDFVLTIKKIINQKK